MGSDAGAPGVDGALRVAQRVIAGGDGLCGRIRRIGSERAVSDLTGLRTRLSAGRFNCLKHQHEQDDALQFSPHLHGPQKSE